MARNTIKYQLKQALEQQASYGRSKHQDKISTYEKRMEMKRQGYSYEERLAVNDMKDHIYSYGTMKTYQHRSDILGTGSSRKDIKKLTLNIVRIIFRIT